MAIVFESPDFVIVAPEQPHIARGDGGHLIINPKVVVEDRTHFSRALAIELVKLTMVAGEAMKTVMTRNGVDIGRINYQDNGNWRHELHVHLYGRARREAAAVRSRVGVSADQAGIPETDGQSGAATRGRRGGTEGGNHSPARHRQIPRFLN
jgi:diadenosine tetraphosphate (Ap4A) HIT family hydrolase